MAENENDDVQKLLAKREEQPHGEFHIGPESKAAHTRALLFQEESQVISLAEIGADCAGMPS
jgi:hypothetical protein